MTQGCSMTVIKGIAILSSVGADFSSENNNVIPNQPITARTSASAILQYQNVSVTTLFMILSSLFKESDNGGKRFFGDRHLLSEKFRIIGF